MRLMVVGATSAIAAETALLFAREGAECFLAGRDAERLAAVAERVRTAGARRVETRRFDATAPEEHAALVEAAVQALGGLDAVLVAHGVLPDQAACERDVAATLHALEVNLLSPIALLTALADHFERQRGGTIAVIGSVAGDRGRRSNYVYGTAKGALAIFLDGLRLRLRPAGVSVLTVKPGYVRTPMTASLPPSPIVAEPAAVAAAIHRAMRRRRRVVYAPWFWRPIMWAVRAVPDAVLARTKL